MCRSIKTLRRPEPVATPQEVEAAALQFVRKISGFRKPSKRNQESFDRAVREITAASARMLAHLEVPTSKPAVNSDSNSLPTGSLPATDPHSPHLEEPGS